MTSLLLRSLLSFTALLLLSAPAMAEKSGFTCKYQSGDVGTIIGTGSSQSQAFEDAAEQCFDRHQALVKKLRGPDEAKNRGDLHIDICANISCS